MWRWIVILAMTILPALAWGSPLDKSPLPQPRPQTTIATSDGSRAAPMAIKPKPRPQSTTVSYDGGRVAWLAIQPKPRPNRSVVTPVVANTIALARPMPRPRGLVQRAQEPEKIVTAAVIAPPSKSMTRSKKGSVCSDPSIKGEVLAPITARIKGCGVAEPVQITSVDGVKLSQPAIMDCTTAKALKTWVRDGLQPAFSKNVVQLQVAAHYICRTRNNQTGAKVSEHGRGKAIDISAVMLDDGRVVTVADDWGKTMRRVYKAACGVFSTTLGPGSDGYHENHMHFDTARYRSGAYCR